MSHSQSQSQNPKKIPSVYKPFSAARIRTQINHHYLKSFKNISCEENSSNKSSEINPQKISRKLFGNKLTYTLSFKTHSHRHSKAYCKYLKKFIYPVSYELKPFSNPLEKLCQLGKNNMAGFDVLTFNKTISACKYLQALEISQEGIPVSLRSVKKLRRLESLTMHLKEDQVYKNNRSIQSLKSLSKLDLSIHRQESTSGKPLADLDKINLLMKFYVQLLDLPKLKSVSLNLQDSWTCKYPILIEQILEDLGNSQLKNFKVQAKMVRSDKLNIERIEKFLGVVDFLSLRVINSNNKFIIFDGTNLVLPGTTYVEETDGIMRERERILNLDFKDIAMLDLTSIINNCSSLENLALHFANGETQITLPQDIQCLDSLKNLVLSFESIGGDRLGPMLSRLTRMVKSTQNLDSVSLVFVFSKLKEDALEALCLLHQILKLNRLKNYKFQFRDKFKFRRRSREDDVLEIISKQLCHIRTLEVLKLGIFVQGLTSLQNTREMLVSLTNLRVLHFSIKSDVESDSYSLKFYFPFEQMAHLKELRLRLKLPLAGDCVDHIMRNIHKLKEIKVLEIMEGTLQNVSLKLFCGMLKELSLLKKLKELIINVKIAEDEKNPVGPNEFSSVLKKEVKDLFYSNAKLTKLHIYNSRSCNIKYTR